MCALEKTTIIPGGDANEVVNKPILKMIVLGNHEDVANLADECSLYPPTSVDRKVLWIKSPTDSLVKQYFSEFDGNISEIAAFSVSTKDKIADYIKISETHDYVRIDLAFTKAGLPEFN